MKSVSFFEMFVSAEALRNHIDSLGVVNRRTWMSENLPKEKAFQTEIIRAINGWRDGGRLPSLFMWKQSAAPVMRRGLPDIMCIINGRIFAFEVKRPFGFGEVSAIQRKTIEGIRAAGGVAEVVSFEREVEDILMREGVLK